MFESIRRFHVKHQATQPKQVKTNILVLILVVVMFATLFGSCANVKMPENRPEGTSADTSAESVRDKLPQTIEFAGEKMTILVDEPERILADDSEIGSVKAAVENRNDFISSRYQITLDIRTVSGESIVQAVKENALSGIPEAHALCYPSNICVTLLANNLLLDLLSLPDFDTEASIGEDLYSVSTSIGNHLYLLATDTIPYYSDLYCIYYRTEWLNSLGLVSPVELAKRGEWTVKAFQNYAEQAAGAVMQKSSYDVAQDKFGYSGRTRDLLISLLAEGAGLNTVEKQSSNIPTLLSSGAWIEEAVSSVRSLLKSKSRAPYYGGDASEAFLNGRLCFYIDKLSFIDVLYEMKMTESSGFDYGILPLPTGSDGQYHTPIDSGAAVLCVPVNTPSKQLSGLGLTLLAGAGRITVKQAAIDSFLAIYSFNNDESCMFDIILRNTAFTFANVYGSGLEPVYDGTTGLLYQVLEKGGSLESLLSKAKESFDECIRSNFP